jgi:ankyrin repeat protein
VTRPIPVRRLQQHPDLDQLKRQAKELLQAFLAHETDAVAEVSSHYHNADSVTFALHDAQLVLARAYGFESWPKLKAHVDGITVRRLIDAVRAGDLRQVQLLLKRRPELAEMSADNFSPLHYAVLQRLPEMTRVLVQHGADLRSGLYPHDVATNPLTLAVERGYDDIIQILKEEEQRRRQKHTGAHAPATDELFKAMTSGDTAHAIRLMQWAPDLINGSSAEGWTPLHFACAALNESLVTWLLEHGANTERQGQDGFTAMDVAASQFARRQTDYPERFKKVAGILRQHGALLSDRAAVALGDSDWIRRRHGESLLSGPVDNGGGGLLRIAVTHNRPEILTLLLDLGLDPDERVRVRNSEPAEYSWGFPLWECAATSKHEMASILLARGADPNGEVYASGTPVSEAFGQRDMKMVELLRHHGGTVTAGMAALYRQTDLAKQILSNSADPRTEAGAMLGGAACGGDVELLRLALESNDWLREDPRWFGVLEQPLRIWNHGPGHWAHHEWDRSSYLTCFRIILERADPNIRGRGPDQGQFGLTMLHSVAASREHMTAAERVAFATMLLDAGARLNMRDNVLKSTPLGWACRWGRSELVKLFLERGADAVEIDAEPWATPEAWAEKMGHRDILALLQP